MAKETDKILQNIYAELNIIKTQVAVANEKLLRINGSIDRAEKERRLNTTFRIRGNAYIGILYIIITAILIPLVVGYIKFNFF